MNAWVRRLENDNQVARVSCYSDSVRIYEAEDGPAMALEGQRLTEYLKLCHESGGNMMWRVKGGYLMYMGEDSRGARFFKIAFVWRGSDVSSTPDCSSIGDPGDFGRCRVPLDEDWIVFYEWTTRDANRPE